MFLIFPPSLPPVWDNGYWRVQAVRLMDSFFFFFFFFCFVCLFLHALSLHLRVPPLCLSRRVRFISVWTDGVFLFCFFWRRSLVTARLKRSVSSWLHNLPCGASMQKLITPAEGIKFSPVSVCRLDNYLNDTTVEREKKQKNIFSAHPANFN